MERLISFKTAKLAKEKGFDLECFRCYHADGMLEEIFKSSDIVYLSDFYSNYNSRENYFSAPGQDTLISWLIEEFELYIGITFSKKHMGTFSYSIQGTGGTELIDYRSNRRFKNYEDAKEDALNHCLELIIAK